MLYVEETLDEEEQIIYIAEYHWVHTLSAYVVLIAFWWVMGLGIYWFFRKMQRRWRTSMVVTDKRLVIQKGRHGRNVIDCGLERVLGCKVHQDSWGRWLGYGTLTIAAAGLGEIKLTRYLRDPIELRMVLLGQLRPDLPAPRTANWQLDSDADHYDDDQAGMEAEAATP